MCVRYIGRRHGDTIKRCGHSVVCQITATDTRTLPACADASVETPTRDGVLTPFPSISEPWTEHANHIMTLTHVGRRWNATPCLGHACWESAYPRRTRDPVPSFRGLEHSRLRHQASMRHSRTAWATRSPRTPEGPCASASRAPAPTATPSTVRTAQIMHRHTRDCHPALLATVSLVDHNDYMIGRLAAETKRARWTWPTSCYQARFR